ncbi:MAG: tetratricopeptide repeat protein, partial [Deltaproteobacteria bacterium]|nr:tetratricopeptide repeat protein [Deltaproteobacteria bacterium]
MSAHKSHKQKKSKKPSIPEPPGIKLHKLHLINVCLLILVGTILYFNTLNAPFLFDDIRNILESSWVKTPENFLNHYFEDEGFYKHRIIPYGTFALNWHFNRDSSLGYHIVNLAIHILNSLLVYLITLKLLSIKVNNLNKGSFPFLNVNIRDERDRVLLSLAVALLFISHPIQTNAVIYIVQRIEAIMAFFYLLCFYLFIKAVHLPRWGPKKAILYTGIFGAFIMALYSKEVARSLPLLMIVYYGIFGLKRRKISLIRGMLLLLSAGSIMGLSAYILYSSGFHSSFPHWSGPHLGFRWGIKENLYTQANVIMEYIKLLVLPLPGKLNIDHDFPLYKSIFQFPTYLSVLTIIALNLFALLKAKKFPLFCFCILWWFITLIPSSSIWPIWDIMVEYRTYLPGFAFYLFLVLSIHQVFFYLADNRYRVISKHIRLIEGTLLTLLVLSYLWGTYERSFVWRDPISLWMDSSKKSPHKARPHNNLGMAYFKKGRLDEAIAQYEQTLAISPNYAKAHNNLG